MWGSKYQAGLRRPTPVKRFENGLVYVWAAAILLLTRPYRGVVGDSVLYIGRALAALDPDGIGRDPMWALDGQMGFSLFPHLARALVSMAGVPAAAFSLSLVGLLLWAGGLVALSLALGQRSRIAAIAVACAVFPPGYSAYGTVYFAEPIPAPRVFAEAFMLLALAAMVRGRVGVFLGLSLLAAITHPIMGLAGAVAGLIYLSLADWRWLCLLLFGAIFACLGSWLGLPVFDRLVIRIDPQWLAWLRGPADLLFPTLWPESAWDLAAVRAATVAMAVLTADRGARRFLVAILLAVAISLLAALLFCDLIPLLLPTQLQPWRTAWLLAAVAPMAFVMTAYELWPAGPGARLALALLACGWSFHATSLGASLAVAAPLALLAREKIDRELSLRVGRALFFALLLLIGFKLCLDLYGVAEHLAALPGPARPPFGLVLLDGHVLAGIVALALIGVSAASLICSRSLAIAATLAVAATAVTVWPQEWDAYRRAVTRAGPQRELIDILAARPGAVLWLGGNQEAWYWARRPNWAAGIQGNGLVFSRELTALWFERMTALSDLEWIADGGMVSRRFSRPDPVFPEITPEKHARFCARADAPAWIIAPVVGPDAAPGAILWRPPEKRVSPSPDGGVEVSVGLYAIFSCGLAPRP